MRCCRGAGTQAPSRRTAAPCCGTPWYLAPCPAQTGDILDHSQVSAQLYPRLNVWTFQENRKAPACALLLLPQAAGHDLQEPFMEHSKKQGYPCPEARRWSSQVCWGWWSWREAAWLLAPQVPDAYFSGIDPDKMPCLQPYVQPPSHLWALSLSHNTKSYIPWLLLRFCPPPLARPPTSSSWQLSPLQVNLCPLPGKLSASLQTYVPPPFISSLPGLVSPLFWELHPLHFFFCP